MIETCPACWGEDVIRWSQFSLACNDCGAQWEVGQRKPVPLHAAVEVVREELKDGSVVREIAPGLDMSETDVEDAILCALNELSLGARKAPHSAKSPSSAITEPETQDAPPGAVSAPVRGKA